jgi:hypothetical protein
VSVLAPQPGDRSTETSGASVCCQGDGSTPHTPWIQHREHGQIRRAWMPVLPVSLGETNCHGSLPIRDIRHPTSRRGLLLAYSRSPAASRAASLSSWS